MCFKHASKYNQGWPFFMSTEIETSHRIFGAISWFLQRSNRLRFQIGTSNFVDSESLIVTSSSDCCRLQKISKNQQLIQFKNAFIVKTNAFQTQYSVSKFFIQNAIFYKIKTGTFWVVLDEKSNGLAQYYWKLSVEHWNELVFAIKACWRWINSNSIFTIFQSFLRIGDKSQLEFFLGFFL